VIEIVSAAKITGARTELDLCAAPGGKAIGMSWSGLEVSATDRDEPRLALLRQSVERVAPEVKIIPRAGVASLAEQDLVWVDAPCTGTGILRRHPDVRWLRREKDIASLNALQAGLIREAWGKVKPGGYLAYSVCSVLKEEGPGMIEKARLPGALVKTWFLLPQLAPSGDGFWAALIRKD
jgi:16S rRNA (cytosine967-C5)-methyltransferase